MSVKESEILAYCRKYNSEHRHTTCYILTAKLFQELLALGYKLNREGELTFKEKSSISRDGFSKRVPIKLSSSETNQTIFDLDSGDSLWEIPACNCMPYGMSWKSVEESSEDELAQEYVLFNFSKSISSVKVIPKTFLEKDYPFVTVEVQTAVEKPILELLPGLAAAMGYNNVTVPENLATLRSLIECGYVLRKK